MEDDTAVTYAECLFEDQVLAGVAMGCTMGTCAADWCQGLQQRGTDFGREKGVEKTDKIVIACSLGSVKFSCFPPLLSLYIKKALHFSLM